MLNLLNIVLNQPITGAAMGVISIGVITALVPLAIAALNSRDDKEAFYRKVILRSVFNQTRAFFGFIFLFIPLVFWSGNMLFSNIIITLLWAMGLYLIFPIFTSHLKWFSGHTKTFIKKYFEGDDIPKSRVSDWTEYWSIETERLDEEFIEVFFSNINNWNLSDDNEKLKMINPLIFTIAPALKKVNVVSFANQDGVLARLLNLRLSLWESEQHNRYVRKNKIGSAHQHWGLEGIDEMIMNILLRSLTENYAYGFFDIFEKHLEEVLALEKNAIRAENGTELRYLDSLLYRFYNTLFDHVGKSNEVREIWGSYFPDILKIKSANLKEERSEINVITIDSYFRFAAKRIAEQEERKYDWQLDKIMRGIFPFVDFVIWGVFTEIHSYSHSPQTAIETLITQGRIVGSYNMSSITVWGDVSDEEVARQFKEQEELAREETRKIFEQFRFGYITSEAYLDKCLQLAREFETSKLDEHADSRKNRLVDTLQFIISVYKKSEE